MGVSAFAGPAGRVQLPRWPTQISSLMSGLGPGLMDGAGSIPLWIVMGLAMGARPH